MTAAACTALFQLLKPPGAFQSPRGASLMHCSCACCALGTPAAIRPAFSPLAHTPEPAVVHAVAAVRLKDQTTGATVPLLAVGATLPAGGRPVLSTGIQCSQEHELPVALRHVDTPSLDHQLPPLQHRPGEDYPCGGRLLLFEVTRDSSGQWSGRQVYSR